jgi:hypothetical protein
LGKARSFALGDQHRNQRVVLFGSKRLHHSMPRSLQRGLQLNLKISYLKFR